MTNARQTRPGVWEFQDEGMNVPGRIYATEKLFSTIEEGVFRQVRNVAKLPGILNASMAMPDAHYGYGFPIGGVAAFNLEKGVVSPGGVGYDINCLHGETEVLMADGSKLNIEDIELKDKVLVYTNSGVKKSRVLLTLTKKDNIYEVHTKQGFKINATADHPFLTPSGMLPLKSIGLGGVIALHENNLKWSVITSIRSVEKDALVYDFMVENENHNFIANNFVVSNCGVRLMTTNLSEAEVRPKLRQLMDDLFDNVPSGLGSKSRFRASDTQLNQACVEGAGWAVKEGFGNVEDLKHTEEEGCIKGADPSKISPRAKDRGKPQIGTLGSGNHFLEVQKVDKIFDQKTAEKFGINNLGQITVMIHCGSRGLGYQVADDYIAIMLAAARKYGIQLPDNELACAPLNSKEADDYIKAMYCAVNYAFCNRQMIAHWVRETLTDLFKNCEVKQVYDVCHNIAKFEEHKNVGRVCVHRKGATRAFSAGRSEIPTAYREVGQPVIIPGDMGTASYILIGTEKAMEETFGSVCHGAGRVMSRTKATHMCRGEEVKRKLENKGQIIRADSWKVLAEEAPEAYKNIDEVIRSVELAGLSKPIARLVPLGVAKG